MPVQSTKSSPKKRAVNVTLRVELIDEAKAFGTNISAVLDRALEEEHRERRLALAREKNKAFAEAWNEWIEEHGIPFAELRPW